MEDTGIMSGFPSKSSIFSVEPIFHIVGHCPCCGAPIYGALQLKDIQKDPLIRYSCTCWRRLGTISQVMETK